jgi:hypothetical protein
MGKLLWTIIKDGLIALAFWVVARIVMVYLWGYSGYILSLGLGVILVVSFIGVTLKRIVNQFGGGAGPVAPTGSYAGDIPKRACPICAGTRTVTCEFCRGSGLTTYPGGVTERCPHCTGGTQTCLSCHGTGLAPGVS